MSAAPSRKIGRPPKPGNNQKVSLYLEELTRDRLQKLSFIHGGSLSVAAARAIHIAFVALSSTQLSAIATIEATRRKA